MTCSYWCSSSPSLITGSFQWLWSSSYSPQWKIIIIEWTSEMIAWDSSFSLSLFPSILQKKNFFFVQVLPLHLSLPLSLLINMLWSWSSPPSFDLNQLDYLFSEQLIMVIDEKLKRERERKEWWGDEWFAQSWEKSSLCSVRFKFSISLYKIPTFPKEKIFLYPKWAISFSSFSFKAIIISL